MEEISSQNSDLGLEDLDKLEAKGQAENTKRATSWGIKKFEKWCDKRKLKVDFNCVTPVELNELLRKFYAEVKSEKGQPLTPSTLTGIRAAIHRQLISAPISRSMNIMQDSEFLSANKMFEAKCKLYTKEMNPKPTHKSSIAAGDMLKLRDYFSEGLDSNNSWADPERLLQFVWFSLCFHFGRRGREGWRELSKQSFGIKTDDSGARYVTEIQRTIKEGRSKKTKLILMYVCTRTRRRLIRWVHSNSTLVVFIQAARLSFRPLTTTSRKLNQDGFEMNRLAKTLLLS